MRNKGLPLHVNPTMRYYFNTYWGTWNRILQYPVWNDTEKLHHSTIEFSMTPINGDHGDWDEIASIRIRKHGTPFSPKDEFSNVIPMQWWELIGERIGAERRDFMAFADIHPMIDWVKYRVETGPSGSAYGGGGVRLDLCKKE